MYTVYGQDRPFLHEICIYLHVPFSTRYLHTSNIQFLIYVFPFCESIIFMTFCELHFFVMKDNIKCSICFKVDGEIENQHVRLCCEIESQPNLEQFKNTLWESSRQYASGEIYFDLFHFTNSRYI